MKKAKKVIIAVVTQLVIIIAGLLIYLKSATYHPTTYAQKVATSAQIKKNVTIFSSKSSNKNNPIVIFYPGALVEPNSYSIWAKQVANAGYTVKIAHFPMNLAIFNPNIANQLIEKNEKYVIGGHSLGGAMAARYAHNTKNNNLEGIFFLASYADEKGRLDKLDLPALSITATNDGILNWSNYQKNKKYLPNQTIFKSIKGGNHGVFGSYGFQKGDKNAKISNKKQQLEISQDLIKWLKTIKH